ncbi:MAG: hypothetical protein UHG68_05815 [Clostridia bacterium]|nr:hypothetical protein [Clostridia bacterium]
MGLMDKICDKVVDAASSCETIRMPYEELAKIVEREFISGADDLFLAKVQKTAKGGFAITKQLKSANSRFDFHVGARPNGCVWLPSKPVWILDHEYNKFYQLDKNIKWKKFYNAVAEAVNREKTNRNI